MRAGRTDGGWWRVASDALTPDFITETWEARADGGSSGGGGGAGGAGGSSGSSGGSSGGGGGGWASVGSVRVQQRAKTRAVAAAAAREAVSRDSDCDDGTPPGWVLRLPQLVAFYAVHDAAKRATDIRQLMVEWSEEQLLSGLSAKYGDDPRKYGRRADGSFGSDAGGSTPPAPPGRDPSFSSM